MTGKETHRYDDIINLPHHESKTHPRMSLQDRAAQFAPFAALTGHEAAIRETGRLTESEARLDEDALEVLNEKLQMIREHMGSGQEISFTCFVPDEKKDGGAYVTYTGSVKKLDLYTRTILLEDGTLIPLKHIVDMQSELFEHTDSAQ